MFQNSHKAKQLESLLSNRRDGVSVRDQDSSLHALAQLALKISDIPTKAVPTPHKQRLYIIHPAAAPVMRGLQLMNLASYIGGATLVVGLLLTGIVAIQSKPGSNWYEYKSSGHGLRLSLMSDESAKANLQIQYVNDRLQDTQSVLADTNTDSKVKAAALSHLTAETQQTIETVRQVAIAQKNPDLLNKLQSAIDQQAAIIHTAQDPEVKDAAETALKATAAGSKTIAEAQKLVAASNESTLAKLQPTVVTGSIAKISEKELFVGKDTIVLTDTTEITDGKNTVTKPTLKAGMQVTVTATETNKILTAKKIVVTLQNTGKVKGVETEKQKPVPGDENEQNNQAPTEPESSAIQSSFIVENPSPQYSK